MEDNQASNHYADQGSQPSAVQVDTPPSAPRDAEAAQVSAMPAKKFPVGKLLAVIFGPSALLVIVMIVQVLVRFVLSSSEGSGSRGVVMVVNMFSVLLGAVAVIGIILTPVFIIIMIVQHNKAGRG